MQSKHYLPSFIVLMCLFSCNKHKTPPQVEFITPAANERFVTEAVIKIKARISDDKSLRKVVYKIYQREKVFTPQGSVFEINELESMYNLGGGTLDITIQAEDSDGNTTIQKITVNHIL
jgi:hypothetical protein